MRNILDFPGRFDPPATVVTLDRNYRSSQPILSAANAVIAGAAERFTKSLWTDRQGDEQPRLVAVRDEADQARYVADRVLEARESGALLKSQAVLFRASHHSGPLEVELTRRNIPFVKFGGLKFLDAAHVKDVLALLRFAENPRDLVAGFRLLMLIPGIGSTTARRLLDAAAAAPDPARRRSPRRRRLPRSGADWAVFVETLGGLRGAGRWPSRRRDGAALVRAASGAAP